SNPAHTHTGRRCLPHPATAPTASGLVAAVRNECRLKGKRPMQSGKIVVENLYKVFGNNPQEAIELLKEGWSKERILAERGAVIGVSDVSFSVEEGEIFVLMGLSGSGKSTLIRLINRLVEPSSGNVYIDGQNVAKLPQSQLIELRRRDMTMVFQSF